MNELCDFMQGVQGSCSLNVLNRYNKSLGKDLESMSSCFKRNPKSSNGAGWSFGNNGIKIFRNFKSSLSVRNKSKLLSNSSFIDSILRISICIAMSRVFCRERYLKLGSLPISDKRAERWL